MTRIAVAIFHGIGEQCSEFADDFVRDLTARIAARLSQEADVDADFIFKPIFWGPVLQPREDAFCRDFNTSPDMSWQALRRLLVNWFGDIVAYVPSADGRDTYDAVHAAVAQQLRELADAAGPDAPLCIIAHSFGSVIASNYFLDWQDECASSQEVGTRLPVGVPVRRNAENRPLVMGATLAAMITLGSPIALCSLRHSTMGRPLPVPAAQLKERFPSLEGLWLNFYAENDVLAYPLATLSDEFGRAVIDVPVRLGGAVAGWSPLSHFYYWTDRTVMQGITAALTTVWREIGIAEGMSQEARALSSLA